MRIVMKCVFGLILISCISLGPVSGLWAKVWLEDGECGDATFYSMDTVYFYFQADKDCNATIIMRTPWKKKILKENKELKACCVYRSYYDIGTGVTRSDWWKIVIEVKDSSGQEAEAECTFYVPVAKPTTTPPPTTTPSTTPPTTTPAPTTTPPPTTSPPTTTPSPTTPAPTLIPTTLPPSTYPIIEFTPPPKSYTPLICAGILAMIVISVLVFLLKTKKP
ncbi:MAG: hypothetical protein KAX04_03365 [Methanomicrobia archaeon]|nr:hypothetical protein [Methanomicrobia archaeon]